MSAQLIELLKIIASEQIQSLRPMNVMFGTVLSEEPNLTIKTDQKKILEKEFLILSQCVTDHKVDMTVDHMTEDADPVLTSKTAGGGGDASFSAHNHKHSHKHPYKGRKTFIVHQKLVVGEKVILVSVQGGQQYVVLDRLGSDNKNVTDSQQ